MKKLSANKLTIFKIVMRWLEDNRIMTTRLYQSKKTFDRSWKCPPYGYCRGVRYDAYELRKGKWVHLKEKVHPRETLPVNKS